MATYEWAIQNRANHVNPPLTILNDALRTAGGKAKIVQNALETLLVIELDESVPQTGRPRTPVLKDMTIADILHARFMNVPMTEIAKSMGISVRTLHRRWSSVTRKNIHPDTPYSQWP